MRRRENRPLRDVVDTNLRAIRGSLLSDMSNRRRWCWELSLACGHTVERWAKILPVNQRDHYTRSAGRGWAHVPSRFVLPAPARARCDQCATHIRVT